MPIDAQVTLTIAARRTWFSRRPFHSTSGASKSTPHGDVGDCCVECGQPRWAHGRQKCCMHVRVCGSCLFPSPLSTPVCWEPSPTRLAAQQSLVSRTGPWLLRWRLMVPAVTQSLPPRREPARLLHQSPPAVDQACGTRLRPPVARTAVMDAVCAVPRVGLRRLVQPRCSCSVLKRLVMRRPCHPCCSLSKGAARTSASGLARLAGLKGLCKQSRAVSGWVRPSAAVWPADASGCFLSNTLQLL
jgi:hypothetical protein